VPKLAHEPKRLTEEVTRGLAFEVLFQFERTGTERLKADSLIQRALSSHESNLSEQDRGFIYALVMGTLRHWLRLDQWMETLTRHKLKQMTPTVRVLLRLGLFQLYGLSQVPAYAAVNTTVNLARKLKQSPKTIGFLNAVLREAQRRLTGDGFPVPDPEVDLSKHLLWTYGWPEAFTTALQAEYSTPNLVQMAQYAEQPSAGLSLRVNTLKISLGDYQAQLQQAGLESEQPDPLHLPEWLQLPSWSGSPTKLPGYAEGWFYVQDGASMWVSQLLNPQPGERILDLCAAPGSKTTHMAALMQNQGHIMVLEPKLNRLALLQDNVLRLGINIVESIQADALQWVNPNSQFDRVLVDAPCSGSGTLRKHPEILLHLRKMELSNFTTLQFKLLEKGFQYLKPGGSLVYSTCSILPLENICLVQQFLAQNPTASLQSEEQRLIHDKTDGFYAARLLKLS
jgi:16S rRNA (cytosine967-C5)-methyltransferase